MRHKNFAWTFPKFLVHLLYYLRNILKLMMLGESFKQAAPAGWWTQALSSYIVRTWGICQQSNSKKKQRTVYKQEESAFLRETGMCLSLFSTHLGLLLSPSLSIHTGKVKPNEAYGRILVLLSKLLDNYFKTRRRNKILVFLSIEKNDTSS